MTHLPETLQSAVQFLNQAYEADKLGHDKWTIQRIADAKRNLINILGQ